MKKITIALLAFISLFTISCEIGLGAAVDTEPPSIEIQTPPVDSVIRDKFAIAGTWSDDGSIDYVKIKLDRTDGYTGSFEYAAEIKTEAVGKGSWTAVIDPVSDKVIDGSYQATVTIADTTGRKTIRNLTFTVDNTPPIVVLQRPSSIISSIDSETDTYGQIINLTGQAADDNNINTIEMNFYSDEACTTLLNTVTLNNVPATINLDVAKFVEKSENDYSKIYGYSEKKGTVTRYCKIVAYDGAQSYPIDGSNQTAADTRGNKQDIYYLYDDISTAVLANHKITELYSMFNGTYALSDAGRSAEAADVTAIKKLLESKQNSKGKFNLNPANNPTFLLSGRSGLKKDGKDFYSASNPTTDNNITTDSTAIIEVSPGLDGISLNSDSIKVYIVECNEFGNSVDDIKFYPISTKSKSGTGYKFVSTITNQFASADGTKKLTLGKYYLFGVEGSDQKGNPIVPNSAGGYGFYFAASGAAPTITPKLERSSDGVNWIEITDQVSYLPAETQVRVSGTVSVENGMPDFSLKLDSTDAGIVFTEKTEAPFEYSFSKVYTADAFGSVSAQHGIKITAIQGGGKTEKSYTIMYDLDPPNVGEPEIKPIAYKYVGEIRNNDGKKYLNGNNVSIKLSISDAYDIVDSTNNPAIIEILDKNGTVVRSSGNITTPANYTWNNINTNGIDTGDITIRVTAYDRAGNKRVYEDTGYSVDQDTDKPVILPGNNDNLTFTITSESGLTGQSKNFFTSGSSMEVTLLDDDGVKSVKAKLQKADGSESAIEEVQNFIPDTGTEKTYLYKIPVISAADVYKLQFIVTDRNNTVNSTSEFFIKIKVGAPVIQNISTVVKNSEGTVLSTNYTNGTQGDDANYFENKLSVKSGYDSYKVYRSKDDGDWGDPIASNQTGATYSDIIRPEGIENSTTSINYKYKIAGVDEDGDTDSNIMETTCWVDRIIPAITITTPKDNNSNTGTKAINEDSFTFAGTIKNETVNPSAVYYCINHSSSAPAIDAQPFAYTLLNESDFGTKSWELEKNLTLGKNWYIHVYVVDTAGNTSSPVTRKFDVDKQNPILETKFTDSTLTVDSNLTDTNNTQGSPAVSTKTDFKIKYSATDDLALDSTTPYTIEITKDDSTTPLSTSDYTDSVTSEVHSITLNTPEDALYTYKITAKDSVGKTTTKTRYVRLDTKGPVLTPTTSFAGYQESPSVLIKGTSEDVSDVLAVYYSYGAADEPEIPADTKTEEAWSEKGWTKYTGASVTNWSIPLTGQDAVSKNIFIRAVDVNGNVSADADSIRGILKFDLNAPNLTETTLGTSAQPKNSLVVLSGKVWDTNGLKSLKVSEGNKEYTLKTPADAASLAGFKSESSSNNWSVEFPVGESNNSEGNYLSEGTHTLTITVIDDANKQKTITREVTVDTVAPSSLVLTALPTKEDTLASQMTLRGTSADATSGIQKIEITITDANDSAKTATGIATGTSSWVYALNFSSEDAAANWKNVFDTQGDKKLTLKAIDAAGNFTTSYKIETSTTAVTESIFVYDKANPVLIVDENTIPQFMPAAGVTISGTAYDSYKLAATNALKITQTYQPENGIPVTSSAYITSVNGKTTKETWTQHVPLSGEPKEGTYTYEFILSDSVNHQDIKTDLNPIVVDTKEPKITEVKISGEDYSASKWYKSQTLSLSVKAEDQGVSGLSMIEYSTNALADENKTWTALTYDTASAAYKGPVEFTSSSNNLIIRVSDKAGNTTYYDGESENGTTTLSGIPIKIDATAPVLSMLFYQIGTKTPAAVTDTIYVTNNATETVTLYGVYEDGDSGVQALSLSGYTPKSGTTTNITYSTTDISSMADTALSGVSFGDLPANTKTVKAWKAIITPTGESTNKLVISGKNNALTPASLEQTMIRDVTAPAIPTFSLEEVRGSGEDTVTNTVYKNSTGTYFTNNKIKKDNEYDLKTYNLSGTASDKFGLAKVEISGDISNITASIDETSPEDWEFNGFTISGNDAETKTVYITVTDKAGNTNQETLNIYLDQTPPKGIHALDDKNKDLYFRIGDNDNDDISSLTAADKNVGGKYSENTYGNANTIKVRGRFEDPDSGSGVNMIYYKVVSASSAMNYSDLKTQANNFYKKYSTKYDATDCPDGYTGYFAPLASDKEETKRVFYTANDTTNPGKIFEKYIDTETNKIAKKETAIVSSSDTITDSDGKTKYYTNIITNYSSNLSGFEEGINYLILVAVDNVGNAALDSVVSGTVGSDGSEKTFYNASLNVDTVPPTTTGASDIQYTNAAENSTITLSGKASDAAAGIKSIVIKANGKEIKVGDSTYGTLTLNDDNQDTDYGKWNVTIKADSVFSSVDNPNQSITALVTDSAGTGNSQTVVVGNVIVDKLPPTVTLTAPTDADSGIEGILVNGTISLSGTISDANVLPDVAITGLQYIQSDTEPDENAEWENATIYQANPEVQGIKISGNYTYSITDFDTTVLTDKKTYYLRAVAIDNAGNTGYSTPQEVFVSQDSDRPKVNITNLESDNTMGYLLKYGTNAQVKGRVSDDDPSSDASDPKVVEEFIVSATEYDGTGAKPTNLVTSFNKVTGDFTIQPSDTSDGAKTFYIYIKDNGGKEFYTTATTASYLNNPKILINDAAAEDTINNSVFTYHSDSKSPTPGDGKGLPYYEETENGNTTKVIAKDDSDVDFAETNDNSTLNANFVLGGSKRKFVKFYFTATDASGIGGMTLKISDMEATPTVKLRLKTADAITGASTVANDSERLALYELDVGTNKGTWTGSTDGSTPAEWKTDYIDISKWATGQYSVEVKSYDRIGNSATDSKTFWIDNTAPTISIGSPENGEEKTGVIKIAGTTSETGKAGLESTMWLIPTAAQVTTANGKTGDAKLEYLRTLGWSDKLAAQKTYAAWQFDFDGAQEGNPTFETYDNATYATPVNGIYNLPVYFMATDKLGNYTIKQDYAINHNPDGDKSKVTITYPTKENYKTGKNFATLGGTISVTGSAEIPSGTTTVKKVYLQIANDTGAFNATDKAKAGTGTGNYGFTVVTAYDVINAIKQKSYNSTATSGDNAMTDELAASFGFADKAALDAWWGIEVSNTTSWRIQINADGKMNPSSNNETNDIKIRACGVNANAKFGAWTTGDGVVSIHIDNNVPVVSAVVKQYSSAITANPTTDPAASASQNYSADMFLRGNNWYIVLDARDESGIQSVTVKKNSTTPVECHEMSLEKDSNNKYGKRLYIPIDTSLTTVSYDIEATEIAAQLPNSTKATYSFKIDNHAPSLESITNGSNEELSESSQNSVKNSNSVYTIKGVSDDLEEGSGVEHVVFYYMRKSGTTQTTITNQVVLDPMIKPTGSDYSAGKVALSSLEEVSLEGASEKLYAEKINGSVSEDSNGSFNTFTAGSNFDAHIREGGLVKIDGIFRRIESVSGNVITFDPPATTTSTGDAYFAIAQVIDANNTAKKNADNPFQFETGKDDGDGMVESFSKSGSKWNWDASIHSDNMPDGPATLVILAFDKAGNVAGNSYKVMVSNNAPRLAKVFLATDLNKDGSYSDNEFETYNISAETGNADGEEAYSLTTAGFKKYTKNAKDEWVGEDSTRGSFTIKNKLAILPEFVGGNGTIKLVFNNNDTTTADDGKQTGTAVVKTATITTSDANPRTITGDYWALTALGDDTKTATASATKKMSFTFWDSTEEATAGTDSQYAFLRVTDFIVDQVDDVKPNVVVNPFEWTDKDHNSLYQNSSANGHIELESDWTALASDGTTKLTGWDGKATEQGTYLDADPKVSGKIILRGTAYDDTLLGGLSFSMTNFDTSTTTPISVATYGTSGWTITKVGGNNPTMATNFYEVTVEDVYVNQNGHKANWTIAIDTAHLSDVAHIDAVFTVIATDQKDGTANSSSSRAVNATATDDATKHNPSYTMDVVPYITDISTGDMDSGTKKYLRRSASGAYVASVDDATAVTVKGFNLNGGTVYVGTSSQSTSASGDNLTISKSSISKSGKIKVVQTVDSKAIESLNNVNNDKADYNKEPSEFAPNCTDKRYIYMWDTTTTTYSGTEAVMKPVIGTDGKKTGGMTWMYVQNGQYVVANGTTLTNSWTIRGGNFAYNSAGTFFYLFLHDMNWQSGTTSYQYNGSVQWGKDLKYTNAAYYWNRPDTNRLGLDNLSYDGDDGYTYSDQVMSRYQNIQLLADGDNASTTHFAAYYDKSSTSQAIIFRTFKVGTDVTRTTRLGRPNEGGTGTGTRWYSDLVKSVEYDGNYDTSVAGHTAVGIKSPAGRVNVVSGESATSYFDMKYDSSRTNAYIAYYDGAASKLKIAYNNSPSSTPDGWNTSFEVDESAGQYVKMIIDNDGRLHLAYYDSTGSYLKYALITPTFDDSNNVTSLSVTSQILVDTLFTNGMYNSITLKEFEDEEGETEVRPVICSYSISYGGTRYALRTSWPLTKMSELEAGATEDGYTGKWETVVVVSANAPTQDNTYIETDGTGTGYTGNIVVGYTASKLEQAKLLDE